METTNELGALPSEDVQQIRPSCASTQPWLRRKINRKRWIGEVEMHPDGCRFPAATPLMQAILERAWLWNLRQRPRRHSAGYCAGSNRIPRARSDKCEPA